MEALKAAKKFIDDYFPDCLVAFLGGSVVRGEATKTSDLDIVVISSTIESAYRESLYKYGWPIEVFVHTKESYKVFFKMDIENRVPSLPRMCSEGITLKDVADLAKVIKDEANKLLSQGVMAFTEQELHNQRYLITDRLDDLVGAKNSDQEIFLVNELTEIIANFILVNSGRWKSKGKWIPKSLKQLDEELYLKLMNSLDEFYKKDNKKEFVNFVETQLSRFGGKLFDGYTIGKKD